MADFSTVRRLPLDGQTPPAGSAVTLAAVPPMARFVLRARTAAPAEAALGMALPLQACRAATGPTGTALWQGPDEWLLLWPESHAAALPAALADAMGAQPFSLVDVSHRQSGLVIAGPHAADALNSGVALDLTAEAFPTGMCTRTLLGKADITLWRTGAGSFHIEAWRSFLPYVWQFLVEASRDYSA